MKKVKVVLNRAGVRELLRSDEMESVLEKKASGIRDRCGDGYEADSYKASNRAKATVWTATPDAMRDNSNNNTLLKGMR